MRISSVVAFGRCRGNGSEIGRCVVKLKRRFSGREIDHPSSVTRDARDLRTNCSSNGSMKLRLECAYNHYNLDRQVSQARNWQRDRESPEKSYQSGWPRLQL